MSAASMAGYFVVSYQERASEPKPPRLARSPSLPISSIQSEADAKWRRSIDDLLELRQLAANWDGEGALAPLPELVDSAITFVREKRNPIPPSRIVPLNDGRVTLEWEAAGYYLSLRFESPCQGRVMSIQPDGSTGFFTIDLFPNASTAF
jgi:hypothetical protein